MGKRVKYTRQCAATGLENTLNVRSNLYSVYGKDDNDDDDVVGGGGGGGDDERETQILCKRINLVLVYVLYKCEGLMQWTFIGMRNSLLTLVRNNPLRC